MVPHSDCARRRPFINDPGTATVTVVASGAQLQPPRSEAERARTVSVNRENLEIYARATCLFEWPSADDLRGARYDGRTVRIKCEKPNFGGLP